MPNNSNDRERSIFLVRHADAGDPSEWIGPESQRPLSEKGIKQASRLAAVLLDSKLHLDSIRTSPARRCAETAAILAAALDVDAAVDERLATGPGLAQLHELFGERGKISKLMIVGHEPQLAALVAELTGIRNISIEKGAALRIDLSREIAEGAGRLVWFAPPALFRAPKRDR
jgi:phosphohistidine phosphatase